MILDHFWVDPGSFGGHLGIVLASFWHHFRVVFGVVLTLLWGRFGPFLVIFGHFSGCFYGLFVYFLWCIRTFNTKMGKMKQYNAKICNFPAKLTKNGQTCAKQKSPFSSVKRLFGLKNGQNRRFNVWKCAANGGLLEVSWEDLQCSYIFWWRSRWRLSSFYLLFHYVWPFWGRFGVKNMKNMQFSGKFDQKWENFMQKQALFHL